MNRDRMIGWLAKNVKEWPQVNSVELPELNSAYNWQVKNNSYIVYKRVDTGILPINQTDWLRRREASNKELSRSDALDWVVDNWEVWPVCELFKRDIQTPPGWSITPINGLGADYQLFYKFSEELITRDDWENWRYRRDGKPAPMNRDEAIDFVVRHWDTWPLIGRIAPPVMWPAGWDAMPGEKGDDVVLRLDDDTRYIVKENWINASVVKCTDDLIEPKEDLRQQMVALESQLTDINRDAVLEWCEDNLIIWPGVEDGAPIDPPPGWVWQQNPTEQIEYMLTDGEQSVTYNDWYKPRTTVTRAARAIIGRLIAKGSTVSMNHVAEVITALNEEGMLR